MLRLFLVVGLLLAVIGCGEPGGTDTSSTDTAEFEARKAAMLADMQNHFDTQLSLPPDVFEALQRGEISQEDVDARAAEGEFVKFFLFKTPADIPTDLVWEDGSDLPDLGSPEAKKGGTLYLAIPDFPRTLRIVGPDSNGSFRPWINDNTRMFLARRHPNDTSIDENGNFRYFPGVAESWAINKATRTVFVKINPNARFSDGESITTDDMMFLFYFRQSKAIQAPFSNNAFKRFFSNITKYDDLTFSITLPEAKPNMLGLALELEPMPMHFFYEFGDDYVERYQWRFVPTSGAYVIEDDGIKKGRSVTLTRNDDWWAKDLKYWRNRYNPDYIQLTVVRDVAKSFEAFKAGELSLASISLPEYFYEKLPVNDALVTAGYVHRSVFYNDLPRPSFGLWMNSNRDLLDDIQIRQGIHHAINYEKVISEYFRGDYVRMRTTRDGFGEFTHPTLRARTYDIERALELFASAGFEKRGDDGVLESDDGIRLSFTLSTQYDSMRDTLTILREEALNAGLDLRLEVLDSTAGFKKALEKQHDIHFMAFGISPEMYPRYWETYHSVNAYDTPWLPDGTPNPARKTKPQTNNLLSIANPKLDTLIEQYRGSDDVGEMQQLAFEMEELLYDDASFVPAFVIPFYRTAYWRWIQWPDDFNVKVSRAATTQHVLWIDTAKEEETRKAMRSGQTFEAVDRVYDQYRVQ